MHLIPALHTRTFIGFAVNSLRRISQGSNRLRELGVRALFLFGSTLRGDARADSDLDLFIDHEESGRFSLFDLLEIRYFLEDSIHVPVAGRFRDQSDGLSGQASPRNGRRA
ncbi:MAG: nucleotidyltransferase domain-containing protein [Magnetospirillum sp. WYHS-4]